MHCRKFIKGAGMVAISIGAFGCIRWNEERFIGDSSNTTDILSPYYRPGAPFRQNLNPADFNGEVLHLSGAIYKEDGKYHFTTAIPVTYPSDENPNIICPAHIHMCISAEDWQDLITQIYFKGDPYIESDPRTRSALSVNGILHIKKIRDNENEVLFDIVLKKGYVPEESVFHKLSGVYRMEDQSMMEFYRDGDFLFWEWNHIVRGGLSYSGHNTFTGQVNDTEAEFELQPKGNAKVQFRLSEEEKSGWKEQRF